MKKTSSVFLSLGCVSESFRNCENPDSDLIGLECNFNSSAVYSNAHQLAYLPSCSYHRLGKGRQKKTHRYVYF